mgnify:CR=1 FL=1
MTYLIWAGAAVSLAGIAGIVWCILAVARAKRAGLDDDALRAVMKRVGTVNLGALFTSMIGLMMVVLGVTLG